MDPTLKEWQPFDFSVATSLPRIEDEGYIPLFANTGSPRLSFELSSKHELVFFIPAIPDPAKVRAERRKALQDLARMAYDRVGAGDSIEARDILTGLIRQLDRDL